MQFMFRVVDDFAAVVESNIEMEEASGIHRPACHDIRRKGCMEWYSERQKEGEKFDAGGVGAILTCSVSKVVLGFDS